MVNTILKKLTTRNYLAVLTGTTLCGLVVYGVVKPIEVSEALANPLTTYIMGQFTTAAGLVYYFFFRKPQSKESSTDPKAE